MQQTCGEIEHQPAKTHSVAKVLISHGTYMANRAKVIRAYSKTFN